MTRWPSLSLRRRPSLQRYMADSERTLVTLEVEDPRRKECAGPAIALRVDYFVVEDDRYALLFGNYTGVWAGDGGRTVTTTRSRYFGDHIHQMWYK